MYVFDNTTKNSKSYSHLWEKKIKKKSDTATSRQLLLSSANTRRLDKSDINCDLAGSGEIGSLNVVKDGPIMSLFLQTISISEMKIVQRSTNEKL